ncbi:MAG: hemerythrin domain-containing protein [Ignavibacteriae bacterium]|nr:hemerythrin domain-containing protein [Ignavibacteriota bacterium]
MQEHSAILTMLDILDAACNKLDSGTQVDPEDFEAMVGFLKEFADACHHKKEESFLFPALEQSGVPREHGPIGVMLTEHDLGRKYIRGLGQSIEAYKSGNKDATLGLMSNARGYINLLRMHIEKENGVLFPLADQRLSEQVQSELMKNFQRIEVEEIGEGKHEQFHVLLRKLKTVYLS